MSFADREPQSANEALLRTIADGADNPFDRDPQSANEYLLKKIAGEDVPEDSPFDREPQSAIEYWLKQIAENGGGGGGVEMETGTFTPTMNSTRPTVYFENEHDDYPTLFFVTLDNKSGDTVTNSTTISAYFIDWERIVNAPWTGDTPNYGISGSFYIYSGSISGISSRIAESFDDTDGTQLTSPLYYVNKTYFRPRGGDTRYFRKDTTYKWWAYWI